MGRIVIAWELGAGYGHVSKTAPIAEALRRRSHDVVYIVRNLTRAETVLGAGAYPLLQAPIWLGPPGRQRPTHSYADILLRTGYADPRGLAALVQGWRELLALAPADLILAEHAPTALLAARVLGLPAVAIGAPYTVPPPSAPWPELRPWDPAPEAALLEAEAVALGGINAVLREAGHAPLRHPGELFEAGDSFICAFPELDCYRDAPGRHHLGPFAGSFGTAGPAWPEGHGPRHLVVADAGYWDLERLMDFMRGRNAPTLAHIRNLSPAQIERWESGMLRVTGEPLDLARLLPECDVVITHGGQGTLHAALLAGKPLLILPMHIEQLLNGLLASEMGVAMLIGLEREDRLDYGALLEPLLADPGFAARARAFAERHAGHDPAANAVAVAARCEALMLPPAIARLRRR